MEEQPMQELLAELLSIDKTLDGPGAEEILVQADELFNVIFKITYYDDEDHAVSNSPLGEIDKPWPHS